MLRSNSATYDASGNQVTATGYRGITATVAYNPAGQVTLDTQPVTATTSIATSFGYDAAGNPTAFTDGNGSIVVDGPGDRER